MPYVTPLSWSTRKIKVKKYKVHLVDRALLRYEFSGFWNKPSGKRMVLSALWQTAAFALFMLLTGWVICIPVEYFLGSQSSIFRGFESNKFTDQQAYVAFLILIVSSFGAIYWQETNGFYKKWDYLAGLFNRVIEIDPIPGGQNGQYHKREHLNACLAQDLLTMGMWAHKSFHPSFKDVLEKAILYKHRQNTSLAIAKLEDAAWKGIKYQEAYELIGDYIEYLLPEEDRPTYLLSRFPARAANVPAQNLAPPVSNMVATPTNTYDPNDPATS